MGISIIVFLMVPIFLKNSAHFDYGFGILMIVVFPLYFIFPFVLICELVCQLFMDYLPKFNLYLILAYSISWIWVFKTMREYLAG